MTRMQPFFSRRTLLRHHHAALDLRDTILPEDIEYAQEGISAIREACAEAYHIVAKHSVTLVLDLDAPIWQIGRNCCHY